MKLTTLTAFVALATAAAINPAAAKTDAPVAAPITKPAKPKSPCAGLAETQCVAQSGICRWRPAIVKGETSPSSGKPYKVSRKAHCRKR